MLNGPTLWSSELGTCPIEHRIASPFLGVREAVGVPRAPTAAGATTPRDTTRHTWSSTCREKEGSVMKQGKGQEKKPAAGKPKAVKVKPAKQAKVAHRVKAQ